MSNKVPKNQPTMRQKAVERAEEARAAQAAAERRKRRNIGILVAVVVTVVSVSLITAVVMSKSDDESAAEPGPMMRKYSCQSCHAVTEDPEGSQTQGPTWAGLYGSEVTLSDGTTVVADEDYLRTAIDDPAAQIVAGFENTMPQQSIPPGDVNKLIAEIEALGAQ